MNAYEYESELLHDAMYGETGGSRLVDSGALVAVTETLPVGVGPAAVQPFESGRSQNLRTTWVEQGWGHDSQPWPNYPFSQLDNPARRKSRLSSLTDQERMNFGIGIDSYAPIAGPDIERQAYWQAQRRSGANVHGAIVEVPAAVPWSDTVPTYGGGAVPHPGIDIPVEALYQ